MLDRCFVPTAAAGTRQCRGSSTVAPPDIHYLCWKKWECLQVTYEETYCSAAGSPTSRESMYCTAHHRRRKFNRSSWSYVEKVKVCRSIESVIRGGNHQGRIQPNRVPKRLVDAGTRTCNRIGIASLHSGCTKSKVKHLRSMLYSVLLRLSYSHNTHNESILVFA